MPWKTTYEFGFKHLRNQDFPGVVIREQLITECVRAGWGHKKHTKDCRVWVVVPDPYDTDISRAFKSYSEANYGEDFFPLLRGAKEAVTRYMATVAIAKVFK